MKNLPKKIKDQKHIELQERKDLLENALSKVESVLAVQRTTQKDNTEDRNKKSVLAGNLALIVNSICYLFLASR